MTTRDSHVGNASAKVSSTGVPLISTSRVIDCVMRFSPVRRISPEPVETVLRCPDDLRRFEFPDPHAPHRFESLKKAVRRFAGKVPVNLNFTAAIDGIKASMQVAGITQVITSKKATDKKPA